VLLNLFSNIFEKVIHRVLCSMQCAKKNLMLHAPPETEGHSPLQIIIPVRNIVCRIILNKKTKAKEAYNKSIHKYLQIRMSIFAK